MTIQFKNLKRRMDVWNVVENIDCVEFLVAAQDAHQALLDVIDCELHARKHLRWWNKRRVQGAPGIVGHSTMVLAAYRGWALRMLATIDGLISRGEETRQDRSARLASICFAKDYLRENLYRFDVPARRPLLALKKKMNDWVLNFKALKASIRAKKNESKYEYEFDSFEVGKALGNVSVELFNDGKATAVPLSENNTYKCLSCHDTGVVGEAKTPCINCRPEDFYTLLETELDKAVSKDEKK